MPQNLATETLILESQDIQKIISTIGVDRVMDDLIDLLYDTINTFSPENTQIPARSGFHYTFPFTGLIEWMPLHARGEQITVKMVGYHPGNPDIFNFPTILSSVYRFDTRSGHLMAIMDGVLSTALRTGAISGVATRLMAKPDSTTLGIIGCGAQSITQIHAISRSMDIETVLYYDTDKASRDSLQARMTPLGLTCDFKSSSIKEIVAQSDVLCTATSIDIGQGPLFQELETKGHLHVNAVGSDFPGKTEVPLDLLRSSIVIPDFKDQAIVEGECQQLTTAEIGPELSALIKAPNKYKYIQDRRSVFDSTGWALEDHVVMDLMIKYANELQIGSKLAIEYFPEDTKNPYEFYKAPQSAESIDRVNSKTHS